MSDTNAILPDVQRPVDSDRAWELCAYAHGAYTGWEGMAALERQLAAALRRLAEVEAANRWIPCSERMPDPNVWVLAWLYLPLNPPASSWVLAQLCYCREDEPESYGDMRMTVNCWWANRRYYTAEHVTHWRPLPPAPTTDSTSAVSE